REGACDVAGFVGDDVGYTRLVDHYSRYIESAVLRLRFLSGALGHECPARFRLAAWMRWLPVVNSLETRALLIVELSKFLPAGRRLPLSFGILSRLYRLRFAVYATCLILALGAGAGAVFLAARVIGSFSVSTEAKGIASPDGEK